MWLAKEYEWNAGSDQIHYVGTIEAHFAGTKGDCLTFTQKHNQLPPAACLVRRDLRGIVQSQNQTEEVAAQIDYSWLVTNDIQRVVVNEEMEQLPEGLFLLDKQQENVLASKPPLLLESVSAGRKDY